MTSGMDQSDEIITHFRTTSQEVLSLDTQYATDVFGFASELGEEE